MIPSPSPVGGRDRAPAPRTPGPSVTAAGDVVSACGEPCDEDLVVAHRRGDPTALPSLIARHRDGIRGQARALLGDHAAAEDVVQEVSVTLLRRLHRWEERARFSTWLRTVTRHAAIDALRRRDRAALPLAPGSFRDLRAPGDAYAALDARLELDDLLGQLQPHQRRAVELCDLAGLPPRAVAAGTGWNTSTVKTRAHRGRRHLERLARPHDSHPAGLPETATAAVDVP